MGADVSVSAGCVFVPGARLITAESFAKYPPDGIERPFSCPKDPKHNKIRPAGRKFKKGRCQYCQKKLKYAVMDGLTRHSPDGLTWDEAYRR